MSFKSINSLFTSFLFIFLFSCKSLETIKNNEEILFGYKDIKEEVDTIDINFNPILYSQNYDHYSVKESIGLLSNKKFNFINTFKIYKNKKFDSISVIMFIKNNKIYTIDDKSHFNIYNLQTYELIETIKIESNLINKNNYPTSLSFLNNNIFISYSDGKILCINLFGNILWEKNYEDIFKTPIRIFNDNLIIILSNKILSLESVSGSLNWEYTYENNHVLQSSGGKIKNLNNILFFILPNNRVGEIDTIFGEKNKSEFSKLNFDESINNSFDSIHTYKQYLSYFDQKKYLTTIDINKNKIVLDKSNIINIQSYYFFNNSLITFHKNKILKSFNIKNMNIYWSIDLNNLIKENDEIINVTNSINSLIIFFKSGKIIEINQLTGELINNQRIKLRNINNIYFIDKYIFINQNNGKTSLFVQ